MHLPFAGTVELTPTVGLEPDFAKQVAARLRESSHPDLHHVECAYDGGNLTLHGRVSSYYLKQLAQSLVLSVEGIDRCVNHLDVRAAARLTW